MRMNYFDFFNLEEAFFINESRLKRAFLENSKKYHPDYHTLEDEETKGNALEMSAINNDAYNVLKDFDKRVEYILKSNDVLGEEGENKVPAPFLMEVMEINEEMMSLEMDFDQTSFEKVVETWEEIKQNNYISVEHQMLKYIKGSDQANNILERVKDYYLKNKYLLRIKEKLDTFANQF